MLKRILVFAFTLTLITGFYFFPAQADNNKLQRLLQITGLDSEIQGRKVRLDRDMLVYGLPSDIPNNDWKPAPTSWEKDNGISLGHFGNQEPRCLGYTPDGDYLASDYFPDDAPNHISPAKRDIIYKPWNKRLCLEQDHNAYSYFYQMGYLAQFCCRKY